MIFAAGIEIDTVWILATLGGAGGVIALLFKLLIISKDEKYALLLAIKNKELMDKEKDLMEMEGQKKSYSEMTQEAIKSATDTTNYYRAKEGKPPLIITAPVVSESHSPSTAKQRETAQIATYRAQLAQIKLVTGQAPRLEPEKAIEDKPKT